MNTIVYAWLNFRLHRMHEMRTIPTDDPVALCVYL